jgi:hypothetical protein
MKFRIKLCNDVKTFLQKADISTTACYSDTVSIQSNIHIKCMKWWERPRKFQGMDEIQKKCCNDLKIFFKLAVSYLQKADERSTAYYSDRVSLQSNIYKKCIRENGKDLESFEVWMKLRKTLH